VNEKEDLRIETRRLLEVLCDVESKFKLYNFLFEKTQEKKSRIAMDKYGIFFKELLSSLICTIIVRLSALTNYDKDSKNIPKTITRFESGKVISDFDEDKKRVFIEAKKLYSKVNPLLEKLKSYRDMGLAHLDKRFFNKENQLYLNFSLTKEEYEKIIRCCRATLKAMTICVDGEVIKNKDNSVEGALLLFDEIISQ
jgi:hypothetical protein